MSTASATRFEIGCGTDPKLENASSATLGSTSKLLARSAASSAISASSADVGWMFTMVSAQKKIRSFSTSTWAADTRETPGFSPTICSAGRIVSG